MPPESMKLEVLLPFRIFASITGVSGVVAETDQGSFGLLPHRLDCVAAVVPGILTCSTNDGGERFVAIDSGVLVKTGPWVRVAVRRAIAGTDLAQLRATVEREFMAVDAEEQQLRVVMARLESGFLRRMAAYGHD